MSMQHCRQSRDLCSDAVVLYICRVISTIKLSDSVFGFCMRWHESQETWSSSDLVPSQRFLLASVVSPFLLSVWVVFSVLIYLVGCFCVRGYLFCFEILNA